MTLLWLLMLPAAAFAFNVEIKPEKTLFRAGDRQELRCIVTDCHNLVSVSWALLEDKPMFAQIHTADSESVAVFDPVKTDYEAALLCGVHCGEVHKRILVDVKVYSFPEAPVVSGHDRLLLGQANTLTCHVSGFYPLEHLLIEWRRGGHVLQEASESTTSTYVFTPTRDDDGGNVSCRAVHRMNDVPEAERAKETTVSLSVLYAPEIVSIPEPVAVRVGSGLTLSCLAEGNPRPEIQWRAIGPGGQDVIVGRTEELVLRGVSLMHSGQYECVASNSVGNAAASVEVTVQAPPANTTISVSPAGEVKEGDNVTVSCRSDGAPLGRLALRRHSNGRDVELQSSDGSSASFTLSSVRAADSAVYECVASNEYGRQSVSTRLSVGVYPLEVKMDATVTAEVGSILVISCEASGCPRPAFSWRSVLDVPVNSSVHTQDSLSRLYLAPVGLTHQKTYTCEVQCGSIVKAKRIEVNVFSFPSDPVIENPGPFLEDRVANLYCSIGDVFPSSHLHIQWLDGEKELVSEVVKNSSGPLNWSQLTFTVGPEHRGKRITCRVSLQMDGIPGGRRERQALTELEVHYATRRTTISVSPAGEVKEGENVTVYCRSDGAPAGRLALRRLSNGRDVELQSDDGSSTSFTLSSIQLDDSAVYECHASNEYGSERASIHLTVRAPPRNTTVQVYPSSQVPEGHNVSVVCRSDSFPAPAVVLRKLDNGMELHSLDGNFLLVNVTLQDAGKYLVNVTNDLGYETEIFSLNVMKKHPRTSPDWSQIIIPAVCFGIMLTTVGLVLDYLRRARRKGFYELAK